LKSAIHQFLVSCVKEGLFPGGSYAIIDQKKGILVETLGYLSIEPEKVKNRPDVIYDVASLTKVISTTTLVMMMIEKKMIHLESKINDYLSFHIEADITIRDCLIHSSGLPADLKNAYLFKNKDDVIDAITQIKPCYQKHEHVVYSDIGFILLGLVIEKVLNQTLEEVAQAWIFKPLGMKDTSYFPSVERTAPTEFRDDVTYKGLLKGQVHDEKAFAMGQSGHAGLFSTAQDIAYFIDAILNQRFVIGQPLLDSLFDVQISKPDLNGNLHHRAYGWDKPTENSSAGKYCDFQETILHTGFTGCNMFIDRKNGLGFVLLTNDVHPTREKKNVLGIRHLLANRVYEERRGMR